MDSYTFGPYIVEYWAYNYKKNAHEIYLISVKKHVNDQNQEF